MSEDLLRKLRVLEEDYPGQPVIGQQADLREINHLRTQLGLPLVDARLKEIGVAVPDEAKPEPVDVPDHTEARKIYRAYLRKVQQLEAHRVYAEQVAAATAGPVQTPVRPLATMGTNDGPLLCDQCGKPIVLEGGPFHGVAADVAWARNPVEDWTSWILGGMVVEIQTNGTLRIYHGYPGGNRRYCCQIAGRKDREARDAFRSRKRRPDRDRILAFLTHEFPDRSAQEHLDLLNEIVDALYSFDPGIGINRPDRAGDEPPAERGRRTRKRERR